MTDPALLLVHSPFVGPGSWRRTAERLRAAGLATITPDLRPALTAAPPLHTALVAAAASAADGADRVVVVPHSNAGRLTGALGAALGERLAGAVLVDALVPAPGTSWVERAPAELVEGLLARTDERGLLPSWPRWWPDEVLAGTLPDPGLRRELIAEAPEVPVAYLREVAPPGGLPARCGYLRLSAGYEDVADELASLGRPVIRRDLGHLATMTHPQTVAADVVTLLDALAVD